MGQKLLICGDSFAADYRVADSAHWGWPNLLAGVHQVTNAAQAGVSEYKIIQQLRNHDLADYDLTVIVHTSAFRVHIKHHPLHIKSRLHRNCDLIYSDILASKSSDPVIQTALQYYHQIYDREYYLDLYKMMLSTINQWCAGHRVLHLCFLDNDCVYPFSDFLDMRDIFQQHPGPVNHLSDTGNFEVFNQIQTWIESRDY